MIQEETPEARDAPRWRLPRLRLEHARLARSLRHLGMELLIVTLGVLIALWVQQWAQDREWRQRARESLDALRSDAANQYAAAFELRMTAPCIEAQIMGLQARVLSSRALLSPAPIHDDSTVGAYVLRMPDRLYSSIRWQAAINDGVVAHFDGDVRGLLEPIYETATALAQLDRENRAASQRLLTLSHPLPLDPGVRLSLVRDLDETRARIRFANLITNVTLGGWQQTGMAPSPAEMVAFLARSGTRRFCRQQRLPLRTIAQVLAPPG